MSEKQKRGEEVTRRSVEARLATQFDREHCVLVGRATTGLMLLFNAYEVSGDVIFPAYTCPSPVYAALYADATPQFCDVRSDYTIDPKSLESMISENTDAVVPIHMFGHQAAMDEIRSIADEYDALVLEDACQSVGTMPNGDPLGSFGDASILSFGAGKPIDVGTGGAVLTDDEATATTVRKLEQQIPVRDDDRLEVLYDHYRELYYAIEDLKEVTETAHQLFEPFPSVFRELYVRGTTDELPGHVSPTLNELEDEIAARKANADRYRNELEDPRITHPDPKDGTVYYRYSIRLPTREVRDYIVTYLRERDIHVSTLYETIHRRFGSEADVPTAERLADETLNLWVTSDVSESYVTRCCETIANALAEYDTHDTE
ncbi:DegT/DnrJ/EryC1/StrS family aminotransferase [Haloarchaeobius baliensis]|uniref:DegT/DnrJ/EryC1/StrS family aminotransferase n=1 Tax=Haloarchaeobius baliensis TaxID=1670458 RepID=UPI003F883FC5